MWLFCFVRLFHYCLAATPASRLREHVLFFPQFMKQRSATDWLCDVGFMRAVHSPFLLCFNWSNRTRLLYKPFQPPSWYSVGVFCAVPISQVAKYIFLPCFMPLTSPILVYSIYYYLISINNAPKNVKFLFRPRDWYTLSWSGVPRRFDWIFLIGTIPSMNWLIFIVSSSMEITLVLQLLQFITINTDFNDRQTLKRPEFSLSLYRIFRADSTPTGPVNG